MKYLDCFRALARRRTDEIVVTSAGNYVASVSRVAAHQAWPELPAEVTTIWSVRWRASARKQSRYFMAGSRAADRA